MFGQPLEDKLAAAAGRAVLWAFFPVGLFTGYVAARSRDVDGVSFLVFDALTGTAIVVSTIMALLTLCWWAERGHGWRDLLSLAAGCAPLLVLLARLDPLGQAPVSF